MSFFSPSIQSSDVMYSTVRLFVSTVAVIFWNTELQNGLYDKFMLLQSK